MENMQRSDLTYYEQAQGFQMMLNMGDNIEDIARKSGFSHTTIRRRIKLLELDQEKFKASIERGATLTDYMELDKIDDPELKNKVLDSIGTNNFRQQLRQAQEQEKNNAYVQKAKDFVSGFAAEIDAVDENIHEYVRSHKWWSRGNLTKPDDADSTQYFYTADSDGVTLYKARTKVATEDELRRQAEKEAYARREAALEDAETRARTLRQDFIAGFSRSKSCASIIDKWLTWALVYKSGELPKNENHVLLASAYWG